MCKRNRCRSGSSFWIWRLVYSIVAGLVCWLEPAAPSFADDDWNPAPAQGDVVLPLPCDQSIVFTRVITEQGVGSDQSSVLDDRRILLGWPNEEQAFLDYLRSDFIAGHFTDGDIRFYLIGKYEVTEAQYKSVMSDDCVWSDLGASMPVAGISWFDAIEFTRRTTGYLLREHPDALERATGQPNAFIRLPTEAEWEFAARGGRAVSVAQFQATRYPGADDNLLVHAWFNDPNSAQGSLFPVGLLEPNPVGLHDIYGNVSEMMFDSFRLNKAGRMHGMAGGFIAKGGAFISNLAFVRSSARVEFSYFRPENSQEVKADFLGVRLVIAGPAFSSRADVNRLLDDWASAAESSTPADEDPIELLTRIEGEQSDLQLAGEIEAVKQAIRAEIGAANEARSRLLNALFLSSAKMTVDIRALYRRVQGWNMQLSPDMRDSFTEQERLQLQKNRQADADRIRDLNYFNHEVLITIANEYSGEEISRQSEQVIGDIEQRNLENLSEAVRISGNISSYLSRGEQLSREDVLSNTVGGL